MWKWNGVLLLCSLLLTACNRIIKYTNVSTALANPKQVKGLLISKADLSTNILDSLYLFSNLRNLEIEHSNTIDNITLPKSFYQLKKLTSLTIHEEVEGLSEELQNLSKLDLLVLNLEAGENDIQGIGQLKKVGYLDITYKGRTLNWPDLSGLQQLETLVIRADSLTKLPEGLHQLPHLESLIVDSNCPTVLPENIGEFPVLKYLSLSEIYTLPNSFTELSALQIVEIRLSTATVAPALSILAQLPQLRELFLKGSSFPLFPAVILPTVQLVNLDYSQLEQFPVELLKSKNLRKLSLTYNMKIDKLPAELFLHQQLEELDVNRTTIQTINAKDVCQMPQLTRLNVDKTKITEKDKEELEEQLKKCNPKISLGGRIWICR